MTFASFLKSTTHTLLGAASGLALTFAVVDGALAQAIPAPAAVAPAVTPAEGQGPALWLIQDADSRIWLFGTVHVLRPNTPWGTAAVDQAFDEADRLVLEITNPDDQAAAMPIMQRYGLSPETPLSSLLTPAEIADLDAAAQALGSNAAAMEPLRPWLAGLTVAIAPVIAAGFDPQSGVDLVLRARALADGKPVEGLETLQSQIQVLASLSEETQLAFLRSALSDHKDASTVLDGMVSAWSKGDVVGIEAIGLAPMQAESQELYKTLLVTRNEDWADQIQTLLAGSGDIFIAVGAAHLAGDASVQAILEDRGVRAVRVQ